MRIERWMVTAKPDLNCNSAGRAEFLDEASSGSYIGPSMSATLTFLDTDPPY